MNTQDLGSYMLIAIMAMAISMALIPLLARWAPGIGMVDRPNDRKVHSGVIPRIGGVGIVLGLMITIVVWLPITNFVASFLLGCGVLLVFGAWDDARELGPFVKFLGQFIAAASIVFVGGVYVEHFPFIAEYSVPDLFGQIFTVVAIMGMINAVNLSDGLDGLAGGEALISLAGIAYMSYIFDGFILVVISMAAIGGIFGFLRFNSHPAKVFMGDGGSQTLGFVLGVLVVYLSQKVNPLISPVIPLLLLGLPVVDALVVFYTRARGGKSLVVAAKDHMHHRLLDLGFYHYESVIIIYSVQIFLVAMAVIMPYESDLLVFIVYAVACGLLFVLVRLAERCEWSMHDNRWNQYGLVALLKNNDALIKLPSAVVRTGLSVFFVASALLAQKVPIDIGLSSAILLLFLLLVFFYARRLVFVYRLVLFTAIGFSVYLLAVYPPGWLLNDIHIVYMFFIFVAIMSFFSAKLNVEDQFQITPLDYLVVAFAIVAGFMSDVNIGASNVALISIQIIVLFYVAELHIQGMRGVLNSVTGALSAALLLFVVRAVL